jgi:hypothetical protein
MSATKWLVTQYHSPQNDSRYFSHKNGNDSSVTAVNFATPEKLLRAQDSVPSLKHSSGQLIGGKGKAVPLQA